MVRRAARWPREAASPAPMNSRPCALRWPSAPWLALACGPAAGLPLQGEAGLARLGLWDRCPCDQPQQDRQESHACVQEPRTPRGRER